MFHYVYRITNHKLSKHYYGVRSSVLRPTKDLGTTYLSSSRDKQFIADQKAHPCNYKYKVVFLCMSREHAVSLEVKLHKRFQVGTNVNFYNKACQTSVGFDTTGTTQPEWLSRHKSKLFSGKGNPFYGKVHTPTTRKNISENHADMAGSNNSMFGKKHTTASKELMSQSSSGANGSLAVEIVIFTAEDIEVYRTFGTFEKVCRENGLPFRALKKTYQKEIKMDNPFKRNQAFKGWYARKVVQ